MRESSESFQVHCEGDGCHLLEVGWDRVSREYRLKNKGQQRIEVRLRSETGPICFRLAAGEVRCVSVLGFEYPVYASISEGG